MDIIFVHTAINSVCAATNELIATDLILLLLLNWPPTEFSKDQNAQNPQWVKKSLSFQV